MNFCTIQGFNVRKGDGPCNNLDGFPDETNVTNQNYKT